MPKMKTHSGAKKRLKKTGSGKIKRQRANAYHMAEHKTSRRKRRLSNDVELSPADLKKAKRLLGDR